ncbi:HNH endonuclease [Streptomyces sp. NBC_00853]|uniref:HNH endonuclease n=1 Tax=Streptomyces sp. NBC_00853 TaxID=2903681 RepID=UPI003872B802
MNGPLCHQDGSLAEGLAHCLIDAARAAHVDVPVGCGSGCSTLVVIGDQGAVAAGAHVRHGSNVLNSTAPPGVLLELEHLGVDMRCIDCTEPATHRGRCHRHHQDYERRPAVRSRRSRSRRRAARYDAAARLRRLVQERGSAWCDWCLETYGSDGVDVDHVRPLSLGGEDVDGNVHVLCHGCHQLKTATDFGLRRH